MLTDIQSRTVTKLSQIIVQILDEKRLLGWKARSKLPSCINCTFSLGITAEAP